MASLLASLLAAAPATFSPSPHTAPMFLAWPVALMCSALPALPVLPVSSTSTTCTTSATSVQYQYYLHYHCYQRCKRWPLVLKCSVVAAKRRAALAIASNLSCKASSAYE